MLIAFIGLPLLGMAIRGASAVKTHCRSKSAAKKTEEELRTRFSDFENRDAHEFRVALTPMEKTALELTPFVSFINKRSITEAEALFIAKRKLREEERHERTSR